VKEISFANSEWTTFHFPHITYNNKLVSDKINKYLHTEVLFNDEPVWDSVKMFTNTMYVHTDSAIKSGYTQMDYIVEFNNLNLFTISFALESMGAYPDFYKVYYNFNLKSGEVIQARDLFNEAAIFQLKKMLLNERQERIDDWKKEMVADDSVCVEETFKECNQSVEIDDFLLRKKEILFYKRYCFPHVGRAYDTDLDIAISYDALRKYLSREGKELLGIKN
jgi:hypothetical protein